MTRERSGRLRRRMSGSESRIEVKDGKLYLVRVNQNIHIELYCIGPNTFIRRHEEQSYTHNQLPEGAEKPTVWGYERVSGELV